MENKKSKTGNQREITLLSSLASSLITEPVSECDHVFCFSKLTKQQEDFILLREDE